MQEADLPQGGVGATGGLSYDPDLPASKHLHQPERLKHLCDESS